LAPASATLRQLAVAGLSTDLRRRPTLGDWIDALTEAA
jgi:hypothetical protein